MSILFSIAMWSYVVSLMSIKNLSSLWAEIFVLFSAVSLKPGRLKCFI